MQRASRIGWTSFIKLTCSRTMTSLGCAAAIFSAPLSKAMKPETRNKAIAEIRICFFIRYFLKQFWQKTTGAFHVLAIFIAEFFDEIGFFPGCADRHANKGDHAEQGNEPVIGHHAKGKKQG